MNTIRSRGLAGLLIVWGLFNMAVPLWREAVVMTRTEQLSAAPGTYMAIGLTALIVGLALLQALARIDRLERVTATGERPSTPQVATR